MTEKMPDFPAEPTTATATTTTTHKEDVPASFSDDGDTSFEIDEPDDEEIINDVLVISSRGHFGTKPLLRTTAATTAVISIKEPNAIVHHRKAYVASGVGVAQNAETAALLNSTLLNSVPLASIKDDLGDNSYSSSVETPTDSTSTTPTTADVADTAIFSSERAQRIAAQAAHALAGANGQNAQLLVSNGTGGIAGNSAANSFAEDNISGSIATTTTEIIDLDNVATVSPNTMRLLAMHNSAQFHHHLPNNSLMPSAAYGQNEKLAQTKDATSNNNNSHKRSLSSTSSYRSNSSQIQPPHTQVVEPKFYLWLRRTCLQFKNSGIGEPSVYHALIVIFLEFFAWGLLTMPVIAVLNQTFPDHTFLMNGLVMGIKGILSFLSAPLVGALSDIWGRKFFLLITVFFTCAPIPLMTINTWWFFAMISISGVFAVTFSVVFAYVADVTTIEERSRAYGLVSATFAASLVISPALGAALMETYSDTLVVALATAIAVLDVFFILVAVPESLPEKVRPSSWGAPISWEQADPFAALRKVGSDHTILMQCVTVLLSYLPEAGQYSCIFVYLKLKMGFNSMEVAIFIAVVGILSISVQVTLGYLMRVLGAKRTIVLGLCLEMLQLLWYGFGNEAWMMWAAGVLAALGSITYPAISAFVSIHSTADRQGAVQGMVTGMRGLCNGLGPAMFGVIFYLFNVDLNAEQAQLILPHNVDTGSVVNQTLSQGKYAQLVPGPPFVFGAFMVLLAICVAVFIPDARGEVNLSRAPSEKKKRVSVDVQYEIENGHKTLGPLIRSDSLAQL